MLLGSTSVKAVRRTLMKLSPGVNFTNILHIAFALVDPPESVKNTVKSSVSFYTFGIYKRKSRTYNVDEIDGRRDHKSVEYYLIGPIQKQSNAIKV